MSLYERALTVGGAGYMNRFAEKELLRNPFIESCVISYSFVRGLDDRGRDRKKKQHYQTFPRRQTSINAAPTRCLITNFGRLGRLEQRSSIWSAGFSFNREP